MLQPISNKPNLSEMISELCQVSEKVWGEYLFARELLANKISEEQKKQMIASSVRCGYETADKIKTNYGGKTIQEILELQNLQLQTYQEGQIGDRILFASYTYPDTITVVREPILRLAQCDDMPEEIRRDSEKLIIAHELFHHIECHNPAIYTQKVKIELWKFLFYSHKSTIRATSEIAAMCFAKSLIGVNFPAFLLDILLVYLYDEQQAFEMFREVIEIAQAVKQGG